MIDEVTDLDDEGMIDEVTDLDDEGMIDEVTDLDDETEDQSTPPPNCPNPDCDGGRTYECDCCEVAIEAGDTRFGYIDEYGVYIMARCKECPCSRCPSHVEIQTPAEPPSHPQPRDERGPVVVIPFVGILRARVLQKFNLEELR